MNRQFSVGTCHFCGWRFHLIPVTFRWNILSVSSVVTEMVYNRLLFGPEWSETISSVCERLRHASLTLQSIGPNRWKGERVLACSQDGQNTQRSSGSARNIVTGTSSTKNAEATEETLDHLVADLCTKEDHMRDFPMEYVSATPNWLLETEQLWQGMQPFMQ